MEQSDQHSRTPRGHSHGRLFMNQRKIKTSHSKLISKRIIFPSVMCLSYINTENLMNDREGERKRERQKRWGRDRKRGREIGREGGRERKERRRGWEKERERRQERQGMWQRDRQIG